MPADARYQLGMSELIPEESHQHAKKGETHACWAAVSSVPVPLLAEAAVSRAMAWEMLVPAGKFRFSPMVWVAPVCNRRREAVAAAGMVVVVTSELSAKCEEHSWICLLQECVQQPLVVSHGVKLAVS